MLATLRRFFSGSPDNLPAIAMPVQTLPPARGAGLDFFQTDNDPGELSIVRYPPFDTGIPVVGLDKLLASQQELMIRIFRTAGVSREDFAKYYEPPIRNLANHVHLLPATATTYFRGTGGLYRMSLEIALHSLQAANASVFPVAGGVERRHFLQPKWMLATFLAGLCSQNYRVVNSMAVLTRNNVQWTPLLDHLHDWCRAQKADVYFVRWMEDDIQVHGAQASAAYSISRVVPHEVLQYLASDNNQVVPSMTAAIAGVETNASENPISRLVAPVITRVIDEDGRRSASNYGHLVIGAHLEPHLVDAMRRLVRGGKWIPNNVQSGGRLWVGAEGVFIDWHSAASDISNLLARDSFAGIPKDQDTLADLLVSANLLELNGKGGRYWSITLPGSMEARDGLVKLKQGSVIFPNGYDLTPYQSVQLILVAPPPKPAAAASQPVATSPAPAAAVPAAAASGVAPVKTEPPKPPPKADVPQQPGAQPAEHGQKKRKQEQTQSQSQKKGQASPVAQTVEAGDDVEPANPNSSGAIGSDVSPTAEKLLGSLKRSNGWLLNEVMRGYQTGKINGVTTALSHGFGISHEELSSHGIPIMELLEELALKGWLWQDKTRASRRIHNVEVDGKTHRMVILKPDVAAGLGFDTGTPRN